MRLMIEKSGARSKVPAKPQARQAWVIYQLKLRGLSLRQLAFKHGFAPNTVSQALVRPHSHVEPILAEALELTPQQLFPERYDAQGRRLHRTLPKKPTANRKIPTVRTGEAA